MLENLKISLKYKDFVGTGDYSVVNRILYGKIEGIDGLVTFEAENLKDLQKAFEESVDDYIAFCSEKGINPYITKYKTIVKVVDVDGSYELQQSLNELLSNGWYMYSPQPIIYKNDAGENRFMMILSKGEKV
jgi:predicted HicB family RNase H-like nuclease